jgi:anaerobic selenocysteine-containing dehydrogenase
VGGNAQGNKRAAGEFKPHLPDRVSVETDPMTVAARLQTLRDKGESHRFAILFGRGWGASDAGLLGDFAKLYGSPNVINHSSMCADGSKKAKLATDGNYSYNAYDYKNANYILNFAAAFLEAFRPYNYLMQVWGHIRSKSPKTRVTAVDVHLNTTLAAADRALYIKPATDDALALAIAHVILTEGLWEKDFVGDFLDGENGFKAGQNIDPATFKEKWTYGLIDWWNAEVKNRTPEWAAEITSIPARDIITVAREFGTTRPAIALFERGPTAHTNGTYAGMCIHALNALVGSLFAKGGLMYQIGVPYGPKPAKADDYLDDYAKAPERKAYSRVDLVGTKDWPLASNMLQEVARNHLAGKPYKLDTVLFYLTNPIFTAPNPQQWEEALKDVFIIDTSPFPGETAMYADVVLPDHTYLERLQDIESYPFEGWPMARLRTPAVALLYDTKVFRDTLIEIGKRMQRPMGEYYKKDNVENLLRHLAKGFGKIPGDNGVDGFDSWVREGVWFKKPYLWRQVRGEFYAWDGNDYRKPMSAEDLKKSLLKTPSGNFEFKSQYMERHADYISEKLGIEMERVDYPQYFAARHTGGGDLHFVTPKVAMHPEGRGANIPTTAALIQPTMGGRGTVYLEIHPETAKARGIRNGDKVRIKSSEASPQTDEVYPYPNSCGFRSM